MEYLEEFFGGIKMLLVSLLFGKTVLLTPNFIDVDDYYSIELSSPISAVTDSANIQIETQETRKMGEKKREGLYVYEVLEELSKNYPKESISVILRAKDRTTVTLDFLWMVGGRGNENPLIFISAPSGVPVGKEFWFVDIHTKVPLKDLEVKWNNYSLL